MFSPKIREAISKFGLEKATEIQRLAFEEILEGKDVLLISPTGTGKTLAALLPIFEKWYKQKPKPVSILYITPLKSLNRDLVENLTKWAQQLGMELSLRHGDTSPYIRKLQAEFPADMFVITLETLQPILVGKKMRKHLANIKWLIIDEVHEIVDSKRGVQLALGLERLKQITKKFQTIMLSATIGNPEQILSFFGIKNGKIIKSRQEKKKEIKVIYPKPSLKDEELALKILSTKDAAARLKKVIEFVKNSNSCLVFTNTREFAEILANRLKLISEIPVGLHHSSLSKEVRIKNEKMFKKGELKGMIATSSLQLGIDIGTVDLVIQYMSPRQVTQLLQRTGRSGHKVDDISKGIIIAVDEDDIAESAVIARRALQNKLEIPKPFEKCYDVLAHQIAGLILDFEKISITKAFEIVKNAWPYRNLKFEEFLEVCNELEKLGIIRKVANELRKGKRIFEYYFSQLSTIPDVKQYRVFNFVTNSYVGTLDEEFVSLHCEEGSSFILNGEAYKIVAIEKDKIIVEPSSEADAIPSWEGELIPVPFEIAQKVGELRKLILSNLSNKEELKQKLQKDYLLDENAANKLISFFSKQKKFPTATQNTIVIEKLEDGCVLLCCFGTLVNETLSKFISAQLSAKYGTVETKSDAYRIFIRAPYEISQEEIVNILHTKPEYLRYYLQLSLENTKLFSWRFVHVAKRFGIIKSDAELTKSAIGKLIEQYRGSVVYKEVMNELETEKLDILKAEKVLQDIQKGKIKLVFCNGPSPLTKIAYQNKVFEAFFPKDVKANLIEVFKERLLNSEIVLACINCLKWERSYRVREIPKSIRCKNCGAILLACIKKRSKAYTIYQKVKKRKKLSKEEEKIWKSVKETAEMFLSYGRDACIALAARGIGPTNARRLLNAYYRDEDAFMRAVLEKEIEAIKTRRFWKI